MRKTNMSPLPPMVETEGRDSTDATVITRLYDRLQEIEDMIDGASITVDTIYWGKIRGLLTDQVDLKEELDKKLEAEDIKDFVKPEDLKELITETALEGFATKEQVALKADEFTVDSETIHMDNNRVLSVKGLGKDLVSKDWVEDELSRKADRVTTNSRLTTLEVDIEDKADKSEIPDVSKLVTQAQLNGKVDTTTYTTDKTALTTALGSKADTFTVDGTSILMSPERVLSAVGGSGGSGGASKWGVITGNLSDQTDLKEALDTKLNTTAAADFATKAAVETKADSFTVDGTTVKMSKGRVLSAVGGSGGASKWGEITGTLTEQTDLKDALDTKLNTTDAAGFATKAAVEAKADSFTVDGTTVKMSEERVLSVVGSTGGGSKWGEITGNLSDQTDLNSKLNDKADKTALDLKADKAEFTSYVSKTDLANGLSTKADKSYVDSSLENKANNTDLSLKADTSYVDGQIENAHNSINSFEEQLLDKADKGELDYKADITYVDSQLAKKAEIIDYDTSTLSLDNQVGSSKPMLSVLNKFSRSVLSTTQFIGTTTGATNVLPYNKGIGIHTITENGGKNPYRLDSFEFSLQTFVHTENSNIIKYIIPLKDVIDGVRLTTPDGKPNYWYSGGALSKSNNPNKTRVSLGNTVDLQFSLFLQSFESTPADHNFTVTFTLYIATPL